MKTSSQYKKSLQDHDSPDWQASKFTLTMRLVVLFLLDSEYAKIKRLMSVFTFRDDKLLMYTW